MTFNLKGQEFAKKRPNPNFETLKIEKKKKMLLTFQKNLHVVPFQQICQYIVHEVSCWTKSEVYPCSKAIDSGPQRHDVRKLQRTFLLDLANQVVYCLPMNSLMFLLNYLSHYKIPYFFRPTDRNTLSIKTLTLSKNPLQLRIVFLKWLNDRIS